MTSEMSLYNIESEVRSQGTAKMNIDTKEMTAESKISKTLSEKTT